MPIITVGNLSIDVDIIRELERFNWRSAKWKSDRLIACSPFRYDNSPSFYVYTKDTATARAGSWGDSGGDRSLRKGNFVTLLAHLSGDTVYGTLDYLRSEYGGEIDLDDLSLTVRLSLEDSPTYEIDKSVIDTISFEPSDYLRSRGISSLVQGLAGTGVTKDAVALVWRHADGRIANIKYRRTDSKVFYYAKGGYPIGKLAYGLDIVSARNSKDVVLVESEIDALYVMSAAKMPAIALGTCKLSDAVVDLIVRSPIERIRVASDNDKAGREMLQEAIKKLSPYVEVLEVKFPSKYKDVNEITDRNELTEYIKQAKSTRRIFK